MASYTPSSISFYLNTPVVLTDTADPYSYSPLYSTSINLNVRWEDATKEIVGLLETYEPITAVVSSERYIEFNTSGTMTRLFVKDGKPYWIKQMKIVPNLDGGIDYYQYFVVRIAHLP